MHFLLLYELAPDYIERRAKFRNEHLKLAWQAQARGELLLAGALAEPADTAIFHFQGNSSEAAERFAESDPYVSNGLVTSYRVRQWNTVVGRHAAAPAIPHQD